MADPFGIIGVVGVAAQIIQISIKFGLDWKDGPDDVKNFIAELQTLKTVLSETSMNITLNNHDFVDAFRGQHSTLLSHRGGGFETDTHEMVSACQVGLESLLNDLNIQLQGHRAGWKRIKGAFQVTKTREAVQSLHRQCGALNQLFVIDSAGLTASIYRGVQEGKKLQMQIHRAQNHALDDIRTRMDNREASEKQGKVLDWLTEVDYAVRQSDVIARRQAGTGQWFLDSPEFNTWVETEKKTLFCPGIPGAGKTILTSIVIEELTARFGKVEGIGIAYIYCEFRRKDEQKASDLLANLLKQLARGWSSLPKSVKSLYEKYNEHMNKQTRPSFDDISEALQSVAAMYSRIFIVVDALDECTPDDSCREKFLSKIFNLQGVYKVNIFTTSRPITEVTKDFKGSLEMEIYAKEQDVRTYLDDHMSPRRGFLKNNQELQDEIKNKIGAAVKGMFLLAQLHLNSLMGKTTEYDLQEALERLPTGSSAYDQVYEDIMERIKSDPDGEKLANQILSWIIFATRPLGIAEIQHALAVKTGESELNVKRLPDIADMVTVCAGLVTVDEESNIIRLAHHTTQEYFERHQNKWFPNIESDITTICVTYLSFDSFTSGGCQTIVDYEERLQSNPFYDYAARNWGHHARAVLQLHQDSTLIQMIVNFLKNYNLIEASSQPLLAQRRHLAHFYNIPPEFPTYIGGLDLAAYFGLEVIFQTLAKDGYEIHLRDPYGCTPLFLAAEMGQAAVVEFLLATAKVDVNSWESKNSPRPIVIAAASGHVAIVKLLIENGAELESRDSEFNSTPMLWAAWNGHDEVVKLLLVHGAEPESRNSFGSTPLCLATRNGHLAVIRILLESGVDPNASDDDGRTSLSYAAGNGHIDIVTLLLKTKGVHVNAKDVRGRTPLSYAAEIGNVSICRWLLKVSIDTDSKDILGRTPLSWAAMNDHRSIVQLLDHRDEVDENLKRSNTDTACFKEEL
ncbi:ankyrin repeat protein [Rutstroemia sp. NJR-2017a WRK4]|nr:ankyrin repeat protein [Rutstroemia sp. NJR-2017a WRK4]